MKIHLELNPHKTVLSVTIQIDEEIRDYHFICQHQTGFSVVNCAKEISYIIGCGCFNETELSSVIVCLREHKYIFDFQEIHQVVECLIKSTELVHDAEILWKFFCENVWNILHLHLNCKLPGKFTFYM
jgi:hypothetical protein